MFKIKLEKKKHNAYTNKLTKCYLVIAAAVVAAAATPAAALQVCTGDPNS